MQTRLGKSVLLTEGGFNATITGLMQDMPENSQIKADMLVDTTTRRV